MLGPISKLFYCVLLVKLLESDAARILAVIPTPSISHQIVYRSLFQELARRGHDVTIVTTDPAFEKGKTPENITEIDVHDISYEIFRKTFYKTSTGNKNDLLIQVETLLDVFEVVFEKQVKSSEFQEILKKEKNHFDLIFTEAIFINYLILSHKFEAPLILVSSLGRTFNEYEIIGAPTHPILNPNSFRQKIYNMTFWDKLTDLYNYYGTKYYVHNQVKKHNEMLRKLFGPDTPSIETFYKNVDMLFLNLHPILEGSQPVPSNVVHVYGIYRRPEQKMTDDLKSYLDNSPNGVIYMSFGTNTDPSFLPPERIQIFVEVFKKLPYNILWKWNNDNVPSNASNIKFGKWFPQSDLLRHPKIKLFITQGGLQSTEEAINAGVPLIGIPMLGDQWYNTEKYTYFKIGEKLDLDSLDVSLLKSNIEKVISDESYRKNIEKLRNLLGDEKETPLERAIWWTEYVIRHKGAKHLRSPYANISWWDYLELDFVFKLLGLVLLVITVFIVKLYFVISLIRRSLRTNKKSKKA